MTWLLGPKLRSSLQPLDWSMAEDLYSVLGVQKTASAGDVTKAYRKLAKKLHPDLNPGDKAAEEKFKEVSHAYSILKDPEQRGKYDRAEIDASGQERPQQRYYREYAGGPQGAQYHSTAGYEDIGAFSDLFGDMFGGGAGKRGGGRGGARFAMRGQDAQYHLDIPFLDAVHQAAHHPAGRQHARRDHSGGRQRRPSAPPQRQRHAGRGRGTARRRAGRDRRAPAFAVHARGQ